MRKSIAVLLSVVILITIMSGCDAKWCVKYEGQKVEPDVFNYYVCTTYDNLVKTGKIIQDEPLDAQSIDGISAQEYISAKALEQVLYLCELEKRYEQSNLEIAEKTISGLTISTENEYSLNQQLYSKLNVSKETVLRASISGKMGYMQQTLFNSIYGEGGTSAISAEELGNFYSDNYICYSYAYQRLSNADGTAFTDKEISAVRKEFDKIEKDVKNGTKKIDDVAIAYAQAYEQDRTCGKNGVTTTTSVIGTTDIMLAAKELTIGEVACMELGGYIFVVQRHDLATTSFATDNSYSILVEMKFDSFKEEILQTALAGNYKVNKKYTQSVVSNL